MICFFILTLVMVSCNSEDEISQGEYEFTASYSATVVVGGVVGVYKRNFETGEVYPGTDEGGEAIKIRIAEHSERNNNCPNSSCYQEFLDVPREFLTKYKKNHF